MTLLTKLNALDSARKIFGKRELAIINKQLLGVELTQSEKNRLSRDIRKKFEFIEKVSGFSEEFQLKKGSEIKTQIQETIETIKNDKGLKRIENITLFGSTAKNTRTLKSDIDISVKFTKINKKDATLFRRRISGQLNDNIDIQVFNLLPSNIKNNIKKEGKILYETKTENSGD